MPVPKLIIAAILVCMFTTPLYSEQTDDINKESTVRLARLYALCAGRTAYMADYLEQRGNPATAELIRDQSRTWEHAATFVFIAAYGNQDEKYTEETTSYKKQGRLALGNKIEIALNSATLDQTKEFTDAARKEMGECDENIEERNAFLSYIIENPPPDTK